MNKMSITIPITDIFKSSLTYPGAVHWNLLSESLKNNIYLILQKQILTHPNAEVCSNL